MDKIFVGKHKGLLLFGMNLLFVVAGYLVMVTQLHLSVDSFNLYQDPRAWWHLTIGRYTNWAITKLIVDYTTLNTVWDQAFFMSGVIVAMAFTLTLIVSAIARLARFYDSPSRLLRANLGFTMAFVNVFMMALLLFPEMAPYVAVGYLALGLAVFCAFSDSPGVWILSLLFLIITTGAYQEFLCMYLSCVFMGTWLAYARGARTQRFMYRRWFMAAIFALVALVFQVGLTKGLQSAGVIDNMGRTTTFSLYDIVQNAGGILGFQPLFLWNGDGLLPMGSVLILLIVLFVGFGYGMAGRGKNMTVLGILAFLLSYGAAFAPHLIEEKFALPPRSNLAVWSALALLAVIVLILDKDKREKLAAEGKKAAYPAGVGVSFIALFMIISIWNMNGMAHNNNKSLIMDREVSLQIADKIKDYEDTTGIEIKNLYIAKDPHTEQSYPGIKYHVGQLNHKIINAGHCGGRMVAYYGGLEMEGKIMSDEKREELFGEIDFEHLDLSQQMIFLNEDAYLVCF